MKANARGLRAVVAFLAVYSIGPYLVRSSAVNALFYERGLSRECIVASRPKRVVRLCDIRTLAPLVSTLAPLGPTLAPLGPTLAH